MNITKKKLFRFVPKYKSLLESYPNRFGDDGAHKQALCLAVIEFSHLNQKEFAFNYDLLPPLWFSQDKDFCKTFCSITNRNHHHRAIALMPYDRGDVRRMIEEDHKNAEKVPFDLFFDFSFVATIAVFVEPRILSCIPKEAHKEPLLLVEIEKAFDMLGCGRLEDIRKTWVKHLMPNNPLPQEQERGEASYAQAFIRMLDAPSFNGRIKNHPQGLSETI
jgi:hypothetical protein